MANALNVNFIKKFSGYKSYRDITNLLPTDLAAGSQNVFITDGVKIDTRGGSSLLGAEGTVGQNTDAYWTLAHRIHSHYDNFVNNQGVKMPFRVWYSGLESRGDVMEVWLPEYNLGIAQSTKKWYQVTANVPAVPIISAHKWYFAEWYDSLHGDNRIVFTYGSSTVSSYSGGFAPIVSTTATTITTSATWQSLGFINSPEGVATIVVNVAGVPTEIALTSGDFSTDTITVGSTTGIAVNDIAFQGFNNGPIVLKSTATGFNADVCSTINNQVYYLDWRQRNVLVSWDRNQNSSLSPVVYQGSSGLNDAVFSGTSTGNQTDVFSVSIDSVVNQPVFTGSGSDGLVFDTSGYTLVGTTNNYKVIVYATGGSSTFTTWGYSVFKNDVEVSFGPLQGPSGLPLSGPFLIADGITFTIPTIIIGRMTPSGVGPYTGYTGSLGQGDTWSINVTSSVDTFTWALNGVSQGSHISLPLLPTSILLSEGIYVGFTNTTGHAIGDTWTMSAYPQITHGWLQTYYTQPSRLPGEGFLISLDSNGWTLQPQQSSMYINGQAGEYYDVTLKLAANLESETITCERLKTDPQKKALFPYLMTSEPNYLSVVSTEKTWDILGQQKFLQLPQSKTFSDQVRVDFQNANWTNAEQTYFNRRQWFILPEENAIFVFDDFMKYWHPPQSFGRRIASIAIIDGQMCGHSYERNETYQIFTSDLNDLGEFPIHTDIVTSYYDWNKRFNKKTINAVAFDGYINGVPEISWTVNGGVEGCLFQERGVIQPIFCVPKDTVSLGKAQYGYHGLGNSPDEVIPHFTYGKTFGNQNYYLRNIHLSCRSLEQQWSITAIGETVGYNVVNNADIFNPK